MQLRPRPSYIYCISAFALLITAWFAVGYSHPDEHFQILEFAGLKLGRNVPSNLPWEYHVQMRSAFQPAIVVWVHDFLKIFGSDNPFTLAFILRVLSAGLAFLSMLLLYKAYTKEIKNDTLAKWFLLLSFLLWFSIYNNARFSSENWSGAFFVIGFSILILKKTQPGPWGCLLIGIFAGLSFISRFQAGLLFAGLFLWMFFIRREKILNLAVMAAGFLIITGTGILIDRWFYGEWTLTLWNYFEQNILLDKVSGFGRHPWWFYPAYGLLFGIPPFSLVYFISILMLFIFRWKNPLSWTILPFLAIHFLIGHKEVRFIFPLFGFIPIIVILSIEKVLEWRGKALLARKWVRVFVKAFWITNLVALAVIMFYPSNSQFRLYKLIYDDYPGKVTLYCLGEDPYHASKGVQFYKRPTLSIKTADSAGVIERDPDSLCLVVLKNVEAPPVLQGNVRLIFSSYPAWIKKVDFNQWVERTSFWKVYEVEKK